MRARLLPLAALLPALAAQAAPPRADPDWPCQQIKVPELSVAAVWAGPPGDDYRDAWQRDATVTELAPRLAQRRMPLGQAEAEIASFAQRAGPDRRARLLTLFAALFDILTRERGSIIAGLDRFGARQKTLAGNIRMENEKLQALQSSAAQDATQIQALTERLTWDLKVFQDRRESLGHACNAPTLVEQRLFALARIIDGLLAS
jgi:hypothetical protein